MNNILKIQNGEYKWANSAAFTCQENMQGCMSDGQKAADRY